MKFNRPSPPLPRWLFLGMALPLLVLNGWALILVLDYFQSPIRIFIIANLLAFILGYPVSWLQRYPRIQRLQAVIIVLSIAVLLISLLALLLIPVLAEQINQLLQILPRWGESGSQQLQVLQNWSIEWKLPTNFSQLANKLSDKLPEQLQSLMLQLINFMLGTAGGLFETGLTLIIMVYLLLKGDSFWHGIFQWFPPSWRSPIRQGLRRSFQNYYIGQLTVATWLGVSLILAFLVFQIPFGLLFGVIIGVMALFPFGGGLSIVIISLIASLNSFWLGFKVLAIATLVDQLIENAIAPRLLGKFTGVHPVWVLLSLIIGVKIAGFLGILIAVPCTGFIKEMIDYYQTQKAKTYAEYSKI
ncbi:MAG: AI-2E family transporter [Snowella sp.]|nr:AI-2E family transporter [Snowella sp.]